MVRHLCGVAILCVLLPMAAGAQQPAGSKSAPVSDALRHFLEFRSKNLIDSAEAMPADKYSFRPTPAQMAFGHLMLHVAGSNETLCSQISGQAKSEESTVSDTDAKEKLVAAVKASFDYCAKVLANVDDSDLGGQVKLHGGRTASRAMAMMDLIQDWADHYSAAAIYLRLNGLVPPTAQPKKQ